VLKNSGDVILILPYKTMSYFRWRFDHSVKKIID